MLLAPVVLGLLVAFSFGTADFLSRGVISKIDYYRTTVYTLGISGVCVLIAPPFLGADLSLTSTLAIVLGSVSTANLTAFIFMYRGYQSGLLSVLAPIVNAYPAVTVILSVLLLGANLTSVTYLALAITISGIALVSFRFGELKEIRASGPGRAAAGVGSALMATLFFGMAWTGFGYAEQSIGYFLPAISMRVVSSTLGFALSPILKRSVEPPQGSVALRLLAMGALEAVGIVSAAVGIGSDIGEASLPVVVTLGGMSAAVTVVYSVTLLKEKVEKNQAAGILILLVGVTSLVYFSH